MTDLEKDMFQRDRSFVVKLAAVLVVWVGIGCAAFAYLDSSSLGDWVASLFQSLAGDQMSR